MHIRRFWLDLPRLVRIILSRLALLPPQIFGVLLATFLLVRLLPGDPALLLLGNMATPVSIAALRERLGLNYSIAEQFRRYIVNSAHGDLGVSIFTSHTVVSDLLERTPATLELITYAMLSSIVVGVTLGVVSVIWRGGFIERATRVYGLAAGAMPDFWIGLLLIFFLFHIAGWAPAPFGRIDTLLSPPARITGFYTIDGLITGNFAVVGSAIAHLALPVATLVVVNAGGLMKMTKTIFADLYRSEFIRHQRACGLPERAIIRSALRNALPPVITMVGFVFTFLLGAAVVVETIFAWGGLGEYAVQAVVNSDYPALQGFVLVASIFIVLVYLAVDILYEIADPRIRV
jgi:ABC-type dipeptide/oligopeptide/nickel transport system permease component